MVCMNVNAGVEGNMVEVGVSKYAPSLRNSIVNTVALVQSALLWGQQLGLTGNYGLGVLPVLVTLISTKLWKGIFEESSRISGQRSCSIWGFGGRGVSMPLLMRKV